MSANVLMVIIPGQRKNVVEADTAYVYEPSQTIEMRGLAVDFFDPRGNATATLTAREADRSDGRTGPLVEGADDVAIEAGRRVERQRGVAQRHQCRHRGVHVDRRRAVEPPGR